MTPEVISAAAAAALPAADPRVWRAASHGGL
jgi:hypothetical protein